MSEIVCELCGATSFMEFNCWMPSFGKVLRANVCASCFKGAEGDMSLAIEIIRKRAASRSIPTPMSMRQVTQLIENE